MTVVGAAPPVAAPASAARPRSSAWPRLVVLIAALSVALPLAVAAAALVAAHPDVVVGDDRALAELALMRAGHHSQLVGPYSRFGWHHPGPSWFYLLALPYLLSGQATYAMYAGTLLLQGAAAVWIVLAVRRHGGAALSLAAALPLLLYLLHVLGAQLLRFPWNPLATMLPMALLLVLAALAAAGSASALCGALIAGSFLVQTHVGTAPVVVAVLAAAGAAHLARRGVPWRPHLPMSRADRGLVVLGLALVVLMWIPPVIDQLTGHPGNLTELVRFLRCGCTPPHPLREALSTAGQMLAGISHGNLPVVAALDGTMPPRRWLAIAGTAAAALLLAVAGRLRRDRFAEAMGVLVVVALATAVVSFTRIAGSIEGYLVIWVTALAPVLAVGWASLLVGARPALLGRRGTVPRRALAAALLVPAAAALAALSVALTQRLLDLPSPAAEPGDLAVGYARSWQLTAAGLDGVPRQPLLVRIATHDAWGTAAALAVQLRRRGWPVHVTEDWLLLFGPELRSDHHEALELVVAGPADAGALAAPGTTRLGQSGQAVVLLRRAR